MKNKKWLAVSMAVAMLGVLAAGCGNSMETEEEIIILKEEESEGSAEAESGQSMGSDVGNLGEIAEQVQAPEHYTAELTSGNITVHVDAPVVVPDGEGFKTYRVKSRPFEQADYDIVSHVLLKDSVLWERDLDAMAASNGFTKGEIEQKIEQMEPVIVEVPAVITVDTGDEQGRNKETGWLNGYATVDGEDYMVFVDNMFREDWRWNTFQIIKKGEDDWYYLNYHRFGEGTDVQKENAAFSIDEIRAEAVETVAAMGFTDFVPSGEEYYVVYESEIETQSGPAVGEKTGYGIHFTRSFDGVPVTYTSETGTTLEDGESVVWPYENLTLVYNEDGLVNFIWGNPYEVEKVSDEYLFLLPFSEIKDTFEEMIIKKYETWLVDDAELDVQINEVRLGYMRVREKGNIKEAAMIPVWDFIGNQRVTYDSEDFAYDDESAFYSRITVNALDGTIIDRELGY